MNWTGLSQAHPSHADAWKELTGEMLHLRQYLHMQAECEFFFVFFAFVLFLLLFCFLTIYSFYQGLCFQCNVNQCISLCIATKKKPYGSFCIALECPSGFNLIISDDCFQEEFKKTPLTVT